MGEFNFEIAASIERHRMLMSHEQLRVDVSAGFKQIDDGDWIDGDDVFAKLQATINRSEAEF